MSSNDTKLNLVKCNLCNEFTHYENAKIHLYSCLDAMSEKYNNTIIYSMYSILAYILGNSTQVFNLKVEERFKYISYFAFDIYKYFYLKYFGFDTKEILNEFDNFCQAVLNNIREPDEQYLRILPNICIKDFIRNGIADLEIIFNKVQINQLNQWKNHFNESR